MEEIDWNKVKEGIDLYNKIMEKVEPLNENFQKKFSRFYRVRRNQDWKKAFFQIFHESLKKRKFKDILEELWRKTDQMEASFASKMLHTLNPQMPIWDSIVVVHQLGIKVPVKKNKATDNDEKDRMGKIIAIYEQLCKGYDSFINTNHGKELIQKFDKQNPKTNIENIKKIDFILWASGKSAILTESEQNLFKLKNNA